MFYKKVQSHYSEGGISDGFKAVRALKTVLKKLQVLLILSVSQTDRIMDEFNKELDKMGVD